MRHIDGMPDALDLKLNFENCFGALPPAFYTKMAAEAFAKNPTLIHANNDAARLIGLDPAAFAQPGFAACFAGNTPLQGSDPLAMVYAGHQFGGYSPELGDGRALLLGQVRNRKGELWDIQLKGSGLTPYSRFGDGRAVLRSCIREYLAGEAMHGLGIQTTRALCIVATDETVQRETMEPGAILTRLSPSHIRFGHFEYFYHLGQPQAVVQLADHVIETYFPELAGMPDRYKQFYAEVVRRTANLVAHWQAVGFAHGVLNTDNMSILSLTIDYGPYGFVEAFDPGFICNHSDPGGRYAFDQQPGIGQWNLYALAFALQPLFSLETAKDILASYAPTLQETYGALMMTKLGLRDMQEGDRDLVQALLALMRNGGADYTQTFRDLSHITERGQPWLPTVEGAAAWLDLWLARVDGEGDAAERSQRMLAVNPKYILRNWVAETVIRAAEDHQDYSVLNKIFNILKAPFDEHPESEPFALPAPVSLRNLCVSCSS